MLSATRARASGVGAVASRSALRQAVSRQAGMSWNARKSSARAGHVGVVDRRIEAAGDLGVQVVAHPVEELVDAVVVRLAARAVRLDHPDALEDEREIALDMRVHAEQEVAGGGHRAVGGGVEGDRPRRRRGPAGVPGIVGAEVVLAEHGRLVVDERGVLEERRILDRAPVLLGGAQIGQREDGVVVAGVREGVEAAGHLADQRVDAARAPGGAVVLAGGLVLRGQAGQQLGPPDVRGILRAREAGGQKHGAEHQDDVG